MKRSKGFCIPHLVTLIYTATENKPIQNQKIAKTLIEVEEKNLCRLNLELAEYVRRQSYEFSEKDRRAVAAIVSRSVKMITGRRGIKLETKATRQKL